jgi:predicted transposase YbfD/YdcC
LKVTTEMNAFIAVSLLWSAIAQGGDLTCIVTVQGRASHEVIYLATTLTPQQACPYCLLRLLRHHWCVENGLHYVRDVTFGEDRSLLRIGQAPQVVAALRNLVITLIHRSDPFTIAATCCAFAYLPERALALIVPTGSIP